MSEIERIVLKQKSIILHGLIDSSRTSLNV